MKKLAIGMLGAVATAFVAGGAWAAELRVGMALEPSSIDPHYHNLTPNNAFARNVFDGLINPDEKQRMKPGCPSVTVRRPLTAALRRNWGNGLKAMKREIHTTTRSSKPTLQTG